MATHPLGGFVLVVIIAPLTEEFLFRGMLLRGLLAHHRTAIAVLYSAILFGVMHGNLLQFQLGIVLGSVFGWWFARTASTGPGLVGHAVFNAAAWFSAVFADHALSLGTLSGEHVRHLPGWLMLSAIGFVALGMLWFKERVGATAAPAMTAGDALLLELEQPLGPEPPLLEIPGSLLAPPVLPSDRRLE